MRKNKKNFGDQA